MRIVLTITVSILASAGFAQSSATDADPSSTLTPETIAIQWEKLMIVTSGETEAEALENLRAHGMSKEGALALMVFRTRADVEMATEFRRLYQEVCAKQRTLRESGGPEMLAQMIEQDRSHTSATRRRLLAEANSLLSPVDQERLEHFYTSDHGPKVGLTDMSIVARVRSGEVPVERVIVHSCGLAE